MGRFLLSNSPTRANEPGTYPLVLSFVLTPHLHPTDLTLCACRLCVCVCVYPTLLFPFQSTGRGSQPSIRAGEKRQQHPNLLTLSRSFEFIKQTTPPPLSSLNASPPLLQTNLRLHRSL